MCEIFPEVDNCCFCISHRVAMMLICVLSVMTGVLMLCCIERQSHASYKNLKNITELQHVKGAVDVLSHVSTIVPTGITVMSWLFMICGLVLLFANVSDQEGLVQVFVWLTFLNVMLGFFMVIGVAVECVLTDTSTCLLRNMDWLSSSFVLVAACGYLCLWIYFICVVNTYVLAVFN